MSLKEQILNAPMSSRKKRITLKRLKHYNGLDCKFFSEAFTWKAQKEGSAFWSRVNDLI